MFLKGFWRCQVDDFCSKETRNPTARYKSFFCYLLSMGLFRCLLSWMGTIETARGHSQGDL